MERVYKTMRNTGILNIVIGSVILAAGVAVGDGHCERGHSLKEKV